MTLLDALQSLYEKITDVFENEKLTEEEACNEQRWTKEQAMREIEKQEQK